jgi:predicted phage terminase large subunit-like protein
MGYPDLKRAVCEQRTTFGARVVLIEDKASGTQLIQELISEGQYGITRYQTTMDKVMRMHAVSSTIENGMVYLPEQANWLAVLLQELATFPKGKYDDQADSVSQALDWIKQRYMSSGVQIRTFSL